MVTRRQLLQSIAVLPVANTATVFAARGPSLTSAPLAGHFTHDSVRLWLQASEATKATIAWWPEQDKEIDARKIEQALVEKTAFSAIATLPGLKSGTRYHYTIAQEPR